MKLTTLTSDSERAIERGLLCFLSDEHLPVAAKTGASFKQAQGPRVMEPRGTGKTVGD
jgi:hypothetical protein